MTTDSFVVQPLRFPGGSVGDLAVNGTVNDLAVMGARPLGLAAAFVLEEGFPDRRTARVGRRHGPGGLRRRSVAIVTGDTKVVGHGAADGLYVTTAGHRDRCRRVDVLDSARVEPGDVVMVSGTLADHGMAVMLPGATSRSSPTSVPTLRRWFR